MQQEHLDGLVAFVSVAEEQGFSAAAVRLGVSASAISQRVRTLERRLGVMLFNRTTRSVSLTEAGQHYYERVRPALDVLATAAQELVGASGLPSGLLRLNIPRAAYLIVLRPILRRFMDAYPDITVEMRVESQLVDIVAQGYDAGIRFGQLVQKDMVAVRVGPALSTHIIASPDYLARHGVPRHPRDLLEHVCINYRFPTTGQLERWEFARGDESFQLQVQGRLIVNDASVMVRCALDGLGVANMINGYIEPLLQQGRLVRLLEDWSVPLPFLHLYYPSRNVPTTLRVLVDFLRAEQGDA